jgi:branched-chain amino acid aminotransferase
VSRVISIDGAIVPPERAVVSVLDRGFLYGDGLFESLRVYGGRPFARDEHIARLARSAGAIGIALPIPEAQLVAELEAAVGASGFDEAYVRITVTRGATDEPSLVAPAGLRATRVILVAPLRVPPAAVYRDGLRACTVAWSRGPDGGPASSVKLLSYVPSLLALELARARGAAEAIFVGADGIVRDAATSNVIVLSADGTLVTPSDGPGVIGGITRGHVLDLALTMGVRCSLRPVTLPDLLEAREVFLTSSIREIASVVRIDERPIGAGVPGDMARALHRAFRQRAGARGPAPWE